MSKMKMIYKYVKWDQYTKDSIKNSTLFFSYPKDYNDPFDINFSVRFDENLDDYKIALGNESDDDEREILQEIINMKENSQYLMAKLEDKVKMKIRSDRGVCCFSRKKKNILLYSHYANGHTGICLCFDVKLLLDGSKEIHNVSYSNNYPPTSYLSIKTDEDYNSLFRSKASYWKYEGEMRMIEKFCDNNTMKEVGNGFLMSYPRKALIEVIIGCKMNDDEIECVKCLLRKLEICVKLTKSRMSNDKYKLYFDNEPY